MVHLGTLIKRSLMVYGFQSLWCWLAYPLNTDQGYYRRMETTHFLGRRGRGGVEKRWGQQESSIISSAYIIRIRCNDFMSKCFPWEKLGGPKRCTLNKAYVPGHDVFNLYAKCRFALCVVKKLDMQSLTILLSHAGEDDGDRMQIQCF